MTTPSRTYSPAQAAYLIARAKYDVAADEAREHTAAFDAFCDRECAGMTEDEADAWLRARCVDAQPEPVLVRQSEAMTALRAAEEAVVAWALGVALTKARTAAQRAGIKTCNEQGMRSYTMRPKLVDLAMRLDA